MERPRRKNRKKRNPRECVQREVAEETGLRITDPELQGELEFIFPHKPADNFYCYVFVSRYFRGEPEDKGEGELRWFRKEDLPLEQMWDDDKYWLHEMLTGKFVRKRFYFNVNSKVESCIDIK